MSGVVSVEVNRLLNNLTAQTKAKIFECWENIEWRDLDWEMSEAASVEANRLLNNLTH